MKPPIKKARTPDEVRRFISENIVVTAAGCWQWQRGLDPYGYGVLQWSPVEAPGVKLRGLQRVSYWAHSGPFPLELHIDHLCRNHACGNPAHMEPVTNHENVVIRSTVSLGARNLAKTACPSGHPYDDVNTRWMRTPYGVGRLCRTCERARYAAKRLALGCPPPIHRTPLRTYA